MHGNGRTRTDVSGPIFHPILALGPQNVGMNQKGIGLRRSLHDKAAERGEEGRKGEGGRSLGGRAVGRENMATINWSSERERGRKRERERGRISK